MPTLSPLTSLVVNSLVWLSLYNRVVRFQEEWLSVRNFGREQRESCFECRMMAFDINW